MEDDERKRAHPGSYAAGPPTIQEQLSPFHGDSSETPIAPPGPVPGRTIQGMPSARLSEPRITAKGSSATEMAAVLVPPRIINAPAATPSSSQALPPDGPTVPDGFPSLLGVAPPVAPAAPSATAPNTSPPNTSPPNTSAPNTSGQSQEVGLDEMATDPYAGRKVKGHVPSPDEPKIQISKSMQYDVSELEALRKGPDTEEVRMPRPVHAPTEVLLPALKKQKAKKERSDIWLVVGLVVLILVILGLLVAVGVGVLQRFG